MAAPVVSNSLVESGGNGGWLASPSRLSAQWDRYPAAAGPIRNRKCWKRR